MNAYVPTKTRDGWGISRGDTVFASDYRWSWNDAAYISDLLNNAQRTAQHELASGLSKLADDLDVYARNPARTKVDAYAIHERAKSLRGQALILAGRARRGPWCLSCLRDRDREREKR